MTRRYSDNSSGGVSLYSTRVYRAHEHHRSIAFWAAEAQPQGDLSLPEGITLFRQVELYRRENESSRIKTHPQWGYGLTGDDASFHSHEIEVVYVGVILPPHAWRTVNSTKGTTQVAPFWMDFRDLSDVNPSYSAYRGSGGSAIKIFYEGVNGITLSQNSPPTLDRELSVIGGKGQHVQSFIDAKLQKWLDGFLTDPHNMHSAHAQVRQMQATFDPALSVSRWLTGKSSSWTISCLVWPELSHLRSDPFKFELDIRGPMTAGITAGNAIRQRIVPHGPLHKWVRAERDGSFDLTSDMAMPASLVRYAFMSERYAVQQGFIDPESESETLVRDVFSVSGIPQTF